jgi:hypothetical protein
MSELQTEYDTPWKDAIESYFEEFIAFFFPQAHGDIDWRQGYEFLDKELQQVVRDAELGKRLVDKLVKIYRTGGEETWVLVHVEVQSQEESNFAQRMYVYHYSSKLYLTRRLYEQGYEREDVINLFRFIDWVMSLPEELEQDFWREVIQLQEDRRMPYITSIERIGIKKGIRQGLLEAIELGLRLKFGDEGLEILPEISEIEDVEQLKAIIGGLLTTVNSLDELRQLYQPATSDASEED